MKICYYCKNNLEDNFFYISRNSVNKLSSRCKKCNVIYNQKSRDIKTKTGICYNCHNKKLENNKNCIDCWFKSISWEHFHTKQHWNFLRELAQKQNYKYVYSGEDLIPGKNMSLDHIISRYDNPELVSDIENVQWVTKDVNMIKNKLSHKAFIKLCSDIYIKFNQCNI